jgi:predicted nucleic acid-binding protein
VLIGLIEPNDAHHTRASTAIAEARLGGNEFVLPVSVLSEILVGAYRKGTAATQHRKIVGVFGAAQPLEEPVALVAARLRARHGFLRLPDALVVATGIVADATVLTCDRKLAKVDDRVEVIEPG